MILMLENGEKEGDMGNNLGQTRFRDRAAHDWNFA